MKSLNGQEYRILEKIAESTDPITYMTIEYDFLAPPNFTYHYYEIAYNTSYCLSQLTYNNFIQVDHNDHYHITMKGLWMLHFVRANHNKSVTGWQYYH